MVTSIQMESARGHKIRLVCANGDVYVGKCETFTLDVDNEPEVNEIAISGASVNGGLLTGFEQDEIESIEILD